MENKATLHMDIVTPEATVYADEVTEVTVDTAEGQITVLSHHMPLVSLLTAGALRFSDREGEHVIALAGGCLEMGKDNRLLILVQNAERAEEIDLERAEVARQRAEKMMQETRHREDVDYARIQAVLDREINRIRVGRKYRRV